MHCPSRATTWTYHCCSNLFTLFVQQAVYPSSLSRFLSRPVLSSLALSLVTLSVSMWLSTIATHGWAAAAAPSATAAAPGSATARHIRRVAMDVALADEVERRRNLAIISHPDAGKTTLTEKLLLYGGAISQAGAVKAKGEQRRATSDFMELEQQRGISISSTVLSYEYDGKQVNVLDTPGHQDFSEDTYRTLAAVPPAPRRPAAKRRRRTRLDPSTGGQCRDAGRRRQGARAPDAQAVRGHARSALHLAALHLG